MQIKKHKEKNSRFLFLTLSILCLGLFFNAAAIAATGNGTIIEKASPYPGEKILKSEAKPVEYRFMWVTRFQIQSTGDVALVVERARKYNFNALFVQVVALGEAFYHSKINPWGKGVTKKFDPLKELIKQAKEHDIDVHAWLNAAFVWGNKDLPQNPKHVIRMHPEWVLKDKKGISTLEYAVWEKKWAKISGVYLDLGIPAVRDHLAALYLEVAKNYEVDGLHFDYIRYQSNKLGYSRAAAENFQKEYQVEPASLVLNKGIAIKVFGKERYEELLKAWDDFRRRQVSRLVAKVQKEAKKVRRDILISAAVVADLDRAREYYFQDWPKWMEEGIIDLVVPMSYSKRNELVQRQIGLAVQLAQDNDRGVIIGLGAWKQDPEELAEKILFTRKVREDMGFSKLLGVSLFSYDSMIKDHKYLPALRKAVFPTKAILPEVAWSSSQPEEPLTERAATAALTVQVD